MRRLLVISAVLASSTYSIAEPIDAGALSGRPETLMFMQEVVNPLIQDRAKGDYVDQKNMLRRPVDSRIRRVQQLAQGTEREKLHHGADPVEIVSNYIHDYTVILGNLLQCMRFQILGLCIEYKPPFFIDITALARYNFPVIKIETVDQPFKSGYFPKILTEELFLRPLVDGLSLAELSFYPFITLFGQLSMTRAQISASTMGSLYGYNYPTHALGESELNLFADAVEQVAGIDQDKRWSYRPDASKPSSKVEFHMLPEKLNEELGNQSPWCHDASREPWWWSDWPLNMLPARFSGYSFYHWPEEMMRKTIFPQGCQFKNIRAGKTPSDMTFPITFPYPGDFPGQEGCMAKNNGDWLPVTTDVPTLYWTDASRTGVMKSIQTALKEIPDKMYTYKPEKGDWFNWSRSDRMPKRCQRLEKWKLDENTLANSVKKSEDGWHVATFWPRFTCCLDWRQKVPTFTIPPQYLAEMRFN